MLQRFTGAVFFLLTILVPGLCSAQSIKLDMHDIPLEQALWEFRAGTGVDVVFAQRVVTGRVVTCRYEGNDIEDALACVLKGTGLTAEPVRRRQYVIVPHQNNNVSTAQRGTLGGFVVDGENGDVLPGAHVYVPGLRLGSVTNSAGYFAIPSLPLGKYHIRISYLGFQQLDTVLAVNDPPQTLDLWPKTFESDSIVVEAQRAEFVDAVTVPGVVQVPVSELEKLLSFPGEQDLFQALQWFPGVMRSGEINGALLVRGGEPDQNLFLIDGAPVYHPWHAFSLISVFQTDTYRDVRLYRGAFPAEHGGRLSSVLDTRLKDGSRAEPRVVAGVSLLNARGLIETPITDKSSFMLSGRRSYIDKLIGREHPVEGDDGRLDTLRTGYYFYDISAKVSYRPSHSHQFSISHYRGRDDLDLRLPFDLSFDLSSWLYPPDLFFEIDQGWGNDVYTFRHQYLYSPRLFFTTTAYYSGYNALEAAYIQPTGAFSLDSDYRVRLSDRGIKVDLDYYHSLSHQVRAGVQLVNRRFDSELTAWINRTAGSSDQFDQDSNLHAWEIVAYAQDAWQVASNWHIQPGLRASYFSGGPYFRLNPRFDVQYSVVPKSLLFRAGVGSQVQYMHRLRDRYSFMYDIVSSRWVPVGSAVRPSSSIDTAAGVEFFPKPWLMFTADAYYRYTQGILLPEDEYQTKDGLAGPGIAVGALLGQYTPGRGRSYGVELSSRIMREPWQVSLNYTIGRSLNRAPEQGERSYRPGRYEVPHAFRGIASLTRGRWLFTLAAEARSGFPHSEPVARYALGDPIDNDPEDYLYRPRLHNARLPAYIRLDAAVGYQFEMLGAEWRAQLLVYNALNRRNVIAREYDPKKPVVQPEDRKGLPILPLFDISLEL